MKVNLTSADFNNTFISCYTDTNTYSLHAAYKIFAFSVNMTDHYNVMPVNMNKQIELNPTTPITLST